MGTVVHLTDQSIQLSANNWNSAYKIATTYQSVSGDFIDSTTLNSVSSLLLPVSIYQEASGNWQQAYTNLVTNSAAYLSGVDLTFLQEPSANWNSTYTTIQSNSSNWQNAYNTATVYQSNSASYATTAYTDATYLPLSGGTLTSNLSVYGSTFINNNLTVGGNLTAIGTATFANTIFTTTSALSVVNTGPGPALYVYQSAGPYDVASFYDGDGIEVLHVGNAGSGGFGKVGVNESFPNEELTVRGSISATEVIYAENGNSTNWNTAYQNVSSQSLNTTSDVEFNQVNANVYLSGGVNLFNLLSSSSGTDLTTVTNYLSTNNVLISALTVAGDLSASKFYGDGSNLTNINFVLSSNNVTLSTTTLDPIATLSSTTFITSRVLQDKLGEVISVKDFGARGNGIANDWLPIQRALSAAAGVARVFIPGGLYFISQELRIPSNSYIYGAGIGSTVIKLSSTANATQCVMTNSQNTRSVATNQGNENIVIKDLELDGNVSRFPGSYSPVGDTSGTGLCLANVHNAFIERVSVHDTCRHCIDICAPETSITFNPLDYVANPSYNIHLKDITAYGAGDDNITTHFSHSIIIENAYVPYTGGTEVPSNSNGIEIDDGSYDITIIGGYIKNCRRGLEIKGHSWAPAAKRVKVYGLTVENCVRNFGIRHLGFDNTDSKTAFDVALYDCTSIAPVSSTFTADAPRSLQISNYDGVFVKDFKVVGEHNASRAVTIQERARNVNFDGITFTQISGGITGITDAMLYIDSTADRNIVVRNAYFRDCIGLPIAAIGSVPGVIIDGVDARTSLSANPPARVIDFSWSPLDVPYIIRNVTTSGYLSAYQLGGTHDFDYPTTIDVGRITNIIPSSPATANTQYTVARFGWREGTGQGLNTGLGTRIEFTGSVVSGVSANIDIPVAYIGTRKVNATDSDATSNLTFGTLSANNSTAVDRLTITPTGNIGINTTTPNERLTVVGNISSTGIISVPNQTALSGSYVLTRDLTDARYFPWSPAAHCFGPIGPAFATNAALGPYMMQSRADSSYVFNWANNSSIAIGLPFFCNNGKSLSSVRINHTAGTNSNASATLEVGLYAANSSGLPDTFIDKVAFSLSATGSKVANLTTPHTPTGLFWALMRPISGDTDFKDVTKGGNGTSLTITGYGNGYNLWASQFFGFGVNDSGPTQFHGSLMPRRGSYSTPLPTSSVLSEIAMLQTASITYPCVILY